MTAAVVPVTCVFLALQIAANVTAPISDARDLPVVCGSLVHSEETSDLFHVGELWMQVPAGTAFHRWLSQGVQRQVAVMLTSGPDQYGDEPDVKILTGTLHHNTAPTGTATVHVVFMRDELTGTLGPITFETTSFDLASRFAPYAGKPVSVVIHIFTPPPR
jgi:hypothetical protein